MVWCVGWRASGDIGESGGRLATPLLPWEGDFLFSPLLFWLLVIPTLQRIALLVLGESFSWKPSKLSMPPGASPLTLTPALLSTSTRAHALSGAIPSLHPRHEEQHFLFFVESFAWLHRWHFQDEELVADLVVGIFSGLKSFGLWALGFDFREAKISIPIPLSRVYSILDAWAAYLHTYSFVASNKF